MKRFTKKCAGFLALVLSLALMLPGVKLQRVEAASLVPTDGTKPVVLVEPGKLVHVSMPVKPERDDKILNAGAKLQIYSLYDASENSKLEIKNIRLLNEAGEEITYLTAVQDTNRYVLDFDIWAKDTLKIGYTNLAIGGIVRDYESGVDRTPKDDLFAFTAYSATELMPYYITASGMFTTNELYPGTSTKMTVSVVNEGETKAMNVYMTVNYGDSGITPNYTVKDIKIGDLEPGQKVRKELPIIVREDTEPGQYEISFTFKAKDTDGTDGDSNTQSVFVKINDPGKDDTDNRPVISLSTEDNYKEVIAGSRDSIKVKVTNNGNVAAKGLKLVCTEGFGSAYGITKTYTTEALTVAELAAGKSTIIEVPFSVAKKAEAGLRDLTFDLSYSDEKKAEYKAEAMMLYVSVLESTVETEPEKAAPVLTIDTDDNYMVIEPSSHDSVIFKITNNGTVKADNIRLACTTGFGDGITEDYTTEYISIASLEPGAETEVEVPFIVGTRVPAGLNKLVFTLSYSNADGSKTGSNTLTMYLQVPAEKAIEQETLKNLIDIYDVKQSPNAPAENERVSISFNFKNDGNAPIDNLRFFGSGYSSGGFEPVNSEPYQNEGSLAAGAVKRVTMSFVCGADIPSGTNPLTIGYSYTDIDGNAHEDTVTVYVLNVKNSKDREDKVDVGRPKLIVNAYSTDVDVLRAGETFNFTFSFKNTHATKAAKNIKITLSQAEGVFEPASGTNIFYIDVIPAGGEETQTIALKTKSDAATGDYALNLSVEYEYDDMSEIDKEKGGVTEENNIKLRAIENYRPVIENIYVENWEPINVGSPVDLSFEFYNMGRSTLGNVYVTVEGDFCLANNSKMSYIGAVQGYSQEFVNPQVVPLVGGEAVGILVVHFEDSNGDEVTISEEFTTYVEESMGDDFGDFGDWGEGDWSEGDWGEIYPEGEINPDEQGTGASKFLGLPIWAWIVIGGVVVAGVVVTIILVKKSKKNSAKDDDDEDY